MKVGIITYATGWYLVHFLEPFLESFISRFLPGIEKEFIVIVDKKDNVKSYLKEIKNVKIVQSSYCDRNGREQLMLKWHDLLKYSDEFSEDVTHICHCGNVNQYVVERVGIDDVDPRGKVATLFCGESYDFHIGSFFNNPKSACHCPYEQCENYVHGVMQFATVKGFKVLAKTVCDRLDQDLRNKIFVPWCDETALNSILMKNPTKFRVVDSEHRLHYVTYSKDGAFDKIKGLSKILVLRKSKFALTFLSYHFKTTPYLFNPFKFVKVESENGNTYKIVYSNGLSYDPINDKYWI